MRKAIVAFTIITAFFMVFCISEAKEQIKKEANPVVIMKTSMGEIKIELYPDKAPITVKNFLSYVDKGFYDGTIFHRVIKTFMIQGGGFTPDFRQKTTDAQIKNEASNGLKNDRGTIAMARTDVVDSATSQFFINVVNNNHLDAQHPVFGVVIEGMDVVDEISLVPTNNDDRPIEDVTIIKAELIIE